MQSILWVYLVAINVFAFALMGIDKLYAISHAWRIPEKVLMTAAALFGALGGLLGMIAFRHKIRKLKFKLGIPILLVIQIAVLLLFMEI